MTTADYSAEHASALQDIKDAGAPVTFTRTVDGAYNEMTDVPGAPTVTTITGSAIRVKGNPILYQALGLVLSESPTLLFAPDTYGALPLPGDAVTWSSVLYTVRDVNPVAPSGTAIIARTVISV